MFEKTNRQLVKGFLRTEGKKVVNEAGEEIVLTGWGLGNWLLCEGYMWLSYTGRFDATCLHFRSNGMSLLQKVADRKAERVCYPMIRIGNRADNSTQPSGGIADKTSKGLECGIGTSGRARNGQFKAMREGVQGTCGIHGKSQKPRLPFAPYPLSAPHHG